MKKNIISFILLIVPFYVIGQNKDFQIIDYVKVDTLKFKNIIYKQCPGILSGVPCHRYLLLANSKKESICKIKKKSSNKVYYEINEEKIILIFDEFKRNPFFKDFINDQITYSNSNFVLLSKVKNRKKFQVIDGFFSNVTFYEIQIKVETLNHLLNKNIMINSVNNYVTVLLII